MNGARGQRSIFKGSTWRGAIGALVALCAFQPIVAGTLDVRWDAVAASDLAGYRVYYGTSPGSHSNVKDVGNVTSTQLTGLTDCTTWYVTVRAYDTGGLESTADSNSVKGMPRPVINTVAPTSINRGQTLTFTVTGSNFDVGVSGDPNRPRSNLSLSHTGLTISSYTIDSCTQLRMTVQAATNANTGFSDLTVSNPDLSHSNPNGRPWVFGTKTNAIEVKAASDTTPPTVNTTNPLGGATNVAASVRPTVTFSETMSSASITTSTVRLVDVATNSAVGQVSGSPSLSGAVVTITPQLPLGAGKQYRIEVIGGSSGVKDAAGNAMTSNFTQSPPFTIATDGGSSGPLDATSYNPSAGQTNVLITTTQARVTFNRDMSPLWTILPRAELQRRFRVLYGSSFVAHTANSPSYENNGRTVVITMAQPLIGGQIYVTQANLTGAALKRTLDDAGHPELLATKLFRTSPGWTVEPTVESTRFSTPTGSESGTLSGGSSATEANSNVPVDAVFYVDFQTTVYNPTANLNTIKIQRLTSDGAKTVSLASPPQLIDSNTVKLTPAVPLEPGKKYRIWVKYGTTGVLLTVSNGNARNKGKANSTNFTTEVSSTTQSETLSIGAEPTVTPDQEGGQNR
jgi:hypothetical protein